MNLWIFAMAGGFGGDPTRNQYPMAAEYEWFRFYKWDQETRYPCADPPGCLRARGPQQEQEQPGRRPAAVTAARASRPRWRWPLLYFVRWSYLAGCEAMEIQPPSRPGRARWRRRSRCPTSSPPAATWATASAQASLRDGRAERRLPAPARGGRRRLLPLHLPARATSSWAGVYWVYPANNWGSRAGRRVDGAALQAGAAAGRQRHPRSGR